jgi:catechol 2,3-dioxygenase-like lactoylglutathione lyase family enzyme
VIELHRIDHVCLRVADLDEAAGRWCAQFGLVVRERDAFRVALACDDELCALELISGTPAGLDHVAWELAPGCSLAQAQAHLEAYGADVERDREGLLTRDADGNGVQILPYRSRAPELRLVPHARAALNPAPGHPRKLGHVNFLAGEFERQLRFYTEGLGMRLTDWLGQDGVWLHINPDHHVLALIRSRDPTREVPEPHFHHLAFDVIDIGQMRVALDHLGRHGRWLGWGPARHGVGGNIAAYVRIVEEQCFVELYCDMEQLQRDHQPRHWPDNRHSSNTWGPLPPRSYFRFDAAAIESERESLEMLGTPLPPPRPTPPTAAPAGAAFPIPDPTPEETA